MQPIHRTRTVPGKVAYIMDRNPGIGGTDLVAEVWRSFYWSVIGVEETGQDGPKITLHQAASLPGPERILAAAKSICSKRAPSREESEPWWDK